jgi:protein O-mannosyl-transferase
MSKRIDAESPVKLSFTAPFWIAAACIAGLLFWAYANHFDNEFEFDDDHCIVRNSSLDTLDIAKFMTEPYTYSVLPPNQAWRPGITILNSIDTIRSGGVPVPQKFHSHIFASYVLLGVLVFFMLLYLLRHVFPAVKWTHWVALFGTGFFWLHTANAETINYIIARSDSQSTLMIVLAMVLFMYSEFARRYFLYIIPMAIGFLIKESAIMFAPILFVYCWLFTDSLKKNRTGIILCFVAAGILYYISRKMTPETWVSGGENSFLYLCTQAFVIVHYFFTFLLPVNLSADTDWTYVTSPFDTRVLIGALFIAVLLWLAFRFSKRQETRLAAFGIFWFFIALAPTSSVVPFAEVMNDHRIFFPFIGLIMVVTNGVVLLYRRFESKPEAPLAKWTIIGAAIVLLSAHAVGTRTRCEVWDNNETLWKDVTIKSPGNARGWMNYGLALMENGKIDSAIILFNKTLSVSPNYVYAHINMGVAQAQLGNDVSAESHYRRALEIDSLNPEIYYFYGDWLIRKTRVQEGLRLLQAGHTLSPGHSGINELLAYYQNTPDNPLQTALETADKNPTPENLVALSLAWYNAGEYLQCALTAQKATELKPDYSYAWNNMCAAYNKIGEYEKAIAAGQKAVQYAPEDQLCKNNLAEAEKQKQIFDALIADAKNAPTPAKWLNVSLQWYLVNNFRESIKAAEEVLQLDPNDIGAWNNICAASNKLGDYERGIEAGEKAVALDPASELAKNNLEESKRLRNKAKK